MATLKLMLVLLVLAIAILLSGCGIRKVDFWGAKMEFADGWDVHAGANNIDKVDDRRGVNAFVNR